MPAPLKDLVWIALAREQPTVIDVVWIDSLKYTTVKEVFAKHR